MSDSKECSNSCWRQARMPKHKRQARIEELRRERAAYEANHSLLTARPAESRTESGVKA